ncbi:MAG: M16 family metallopeptidase [Beijerinckiaceae bacterium]
MADTDFAKPDISTFVLKNGMQVVVIPDHRAPVVTHMVWYRNGSADDPEGKSGIAHFLEHLMFKGTKLHPKGAFSNLVSDLGGQENAFTSYDYTAYYQKVAKEHLETMMAFESDRMKNLVLSDEDVIPERNVVLEERRMRTDSDPSSQLSESVAATLYVNHPYGLPIIGWQHEIETLDRSDALAYYQRFYTPENAILVVAGDVTADIVSALAEKSYGVIPPRGEPPRRTRKTEPPIPAARRVELADPKVEQPSFQRYWLVPSHVSADDSEPYALDLLAQILGGGPASRLFKALVQDQAIATQAGAWYMGDAVDLTRFAVYAIPREGVDLRTIEKAVEAVIANLSDDLSERELDRAKTQLVADAIYAQDSQTTLARMYGATLAVGGTVKDVQDWPGKIEAVTVADIIAVARKRLLPRIAVTGYLLKEEAA